ncbi:PH domain-containing protein [Micromonospora chersina]|uniref:PH domain-containing protein n=1 Tax=Micromonospora chersina TaxID=47854 RepID=A0A1C6VHV7_9ACTN|nr:PH domain-containing protein [Micromonospora chersina]SCL65470.1 PH domain-containing protein [Micromonospora chersina]
MVDVQETYRRLEPVHLVFALVWGLGMSLPIAAHWSTGPAMVASLFALDAAGLALVHLSGPAASIVVTPRHVIVRNPFRRYVIPRSLVEGVDTDTHFTPHLLVRDARSIRLAALNLNLPRGYQMNAGRHQRQGVTSMLDRVPEEPNGGPVERCIRYGYLVLAVAAVGSAVAACRYLLSIDPM